MLILELSRWEQTFWENHVICVSRKISSVDFLHWIYVNIHNVISVRSTEQTHLDSWWILNDCMWFCTVKQKHFETRDRIRRQLLTLYNQKREKLALDHIQHSWNNDTYEHELNSTVTDKKIIIIWSSVYCTSTYDIWYSSCRHHSTTFQFRMIM